MPDMNFAVNLLPDSNGSWDLGSNYKKWNVYADGGNVLTNEDIVNNLTSTLTTAPLSANMGKTLNDNLTDYVKIIEASIGTTGTIAGKSNVLLSAVDVSSYVPNGYKLIGAYGRYPGAYKFCFVQVVTAGSTVSARIGNYADTADSGTASVWLICIRS